MIVELIVQLAKSGLKSYSRSLHFADLTQPGVKTEALDNDSGLGTATLLNPEVTGQGPTPCHVTPH